MSPTPLKNDGVRQLGWWHSQYMESHKSHVPNHQPVICTVLENCWRVLWPEQGISFELWLVGLCGIQLVGGNLVDLNLRLFWAPLRFTAVLIFRSCSEAKTAQAGDCGCGLICQTWNPTNNTKNPNSLVLVILLVTLTFFPASARTRPYCKSPTHHCSSCSNATSTRCTSYKWSAHVSPFTCRYDFFF